MTEIDNTSGLFKGAAEECDGPADDEPEPRSLTLLTESECWNTLQGAADTVEQAYEVCADRLGTISGRDVSILLSTDRVIADLNSRYRGENKPTNVLSFPAAAGQAPTEHLPLGDIIIAYETMIREAADEGKPPLSHLAHLTVHGLLHLAGFDHQTDRDAERMESLEREILASMAIPDPYSFNLEEQPAFIG